MGEEGVVCRERGFYDQGRLTAQSKTAITSLRHDSSPQIDAASFSPRNPLATFDTSKEKAEQSASVTSHGLQRHHDFVPLHATPFGGVADQPHNFCRFHVSLPERVISTTNKENPFSSSQTLFPLYASFGMKHMMYMQL